MKKGMKVCRCNRLQIEELLKEETQNENQRSAMQYTFAALFMLFFLGLVIYILETRGGVFLDPQLIGINDMAFKLDITSVVIILIIWAMFAVYHLVNQLVCCFRSKKPSKSFAFFGLYFVPVHTMRVIEVKVAKTAEKKCEKDAKKINKEPKKTSDDQKPPLNDNKFKVKLVKLNMDVKNSNDSSKLNNDAQKPDEPPKQKDFHSINVFDV